MPHVIENIVLRRISDGAFFTGGFGYRFSYAFSKNFNHAKLFSRMHAIKTALGQASTIPGYSADDYGTSTVTISSEDLITPIGVPIVKSSDTSSAAVDLSRRVQELEAENRRLRALVDNRWSAGEDPRRNGQFVCCETGVSWPSCIKGEGDTLEEAIDNAILSIEE